MGARGWEIDEGGGEREIEAWESEKQTKTARKTRASESERETESGEERRGRK